MGLDLGKFFNSITTLPGTAAANRAMRGQQRMADLQAQQYERYIPGLMADLYAQYTNPNNRWAQAEMNGVTAAAKRDYGYADSQLQKALHQRGLNRSSFGTNSLGSLWNAYGQTMAQARQQQWHQQQDNKQRLAGLLMGSINPNAAVSAYGAIADQARARQQGMLGNIAGLGNLIGKFIPESMWKSFIEHLWNEDPK